MSKTSFQLPALPYDFNGLEPVISAEILQIHYSKHHKAYVDNLNIALEKYGLAESKNDLASMIALMKAIQFNGGGHINHSIFWTNLCPIANGGGQGPKKELARAIDQNFGSFTAFKEKFTSAATAIQGSGWGWLAWNKETKALQIVACSNHELVSSLGLVPLLTVDVWEHAYYLQYKNLRADFVKSIWQVINWQNIEERFLKGCI
jgi:Fe-Mn family superoxide dismutase